MSEEEEDQQPRMRKLKKDRTDKKKKKKRFAPEEFVHNYYMDDEAEESSASDEEEVDENRRGAPIQFPERTKHRIFTMTGKEGEEYYRRKDKVMQKQEENEYYLPSARDPTIYAVEVIRKKEQELVLSILNKAACLRDKEERLTISSAAFIEKNPGIIFIESRSLKAVQDALDGLTGILSRKFEVVKVEYYSELFAPKETRDREFRPNSFVRIKSGLYKGDLARIIKAKANGKATVEVVPRIDPAEIENLHREGKQREIIRILNRSKYAGGGPRP
jgi:transcription elongation factor SPT5